ncbi:MAG: hypothetical protein ABI254_00145, partial [Chthoniobacterales bacterium]
EGRKWILLAALGEQSARATANPGPYGSAGALWVPTHYGIAATGRLEGGKTTRLSALQSGGIGSGN